MGLFRMAAVFAAAVSVFSSFGGEWKEEVDLAKAKVYVGAKAYPAEIEAAKLIIRAQRMIAGECDPTNAAPLVAEAWPADGIVVAGAGSPLVKPLADELALEQGAIVQMLHGSTYLFTGEGPVEAAFAVCDCLYRNGARFIHTGAPEDGFTSGTYLEWMKGLKAPASRKHVPRVIARTGFALGNWPKVRGTRDNQIGMNRFALCNCTSPTGPLGEGPTVGGSIGCESIQPPVAQFEKHPEWFPLVDGKRWRPAKGGWVTEGCWSCPGFADWVVQNVSNQYARICKKAKGNNKTPPREVGRVTLNLTNSDGGPKCRCEDCAKYRAQFPDDASWYWDYHAKLSKRINAAIPGLYNYTFAYINSLKYPKAGKQAISHLDAIMYCPYQRCYVHPYSDRDCPTNRDERRRSEEWLAGGIGIGDFDYCYDVFQPSMAMPSWEITSDVVRYWQTLNVGRRIPSMYMECATSPNGCGGKSRASAYAVARALWDEATVPADEHLQDFCRCGFGDAAPEMLAWYRAAAKAWGGQKAHLTSTFNNPTGTAKSYFTEELVAAGEKAFASAEAKIRARMAPEGTKTLTREQNLAAKQYATWAWEKKWMFDAWRELRAKALESSLTVNCELGDPSDAEFDRMPEFAFKPHWGKEDPTRSTARIYRTKDALRIRVSAWSELFEPAAWKVTQGDQPKAYGGNHLEMFLQAPGSGDYYHLCVNASGDRYDALCKDMAGFTSDLWTVTSRQEKGSLEFTVTIPWKMFGEGFAVKAGDSFKLGLVMGVKVPDAKKGYRWFNAGLPVVAYHDLAAAADIVIDDNAGRRAGGK